MPRQHNLLSVPLHFLAPLDRPLRTHQAGMILAW